MRALLAGVIALALAACAHAQDVSFPAKQAGAPSACPSAPMPAQVAGYCTETFAADSFSTSNVDMSLTYGSGFQLYGYNWIGTTPTMAHVTINGDNSLTVGIGGDTFSATVASAGRIAGAPYFKGVAFGGGGYFEACFAYDPTTIPQPIVDGDPSFWLFSLEHSQNVATGLNQDQWTGQVSGYLHWFENDIEEAKFGSSSQYSAGPLDWRYDTSTIFSQATAQAYTRTAAGGTNFNRYPNPHCYEVLWQPATVSKRGSLTYYMDGVQIGPSTSWSQYVAGSDAPPVSALTPWLNGIGDDEHQILQIGTGSSTTLKLTAIHVWQLSAANNVTN